MLLFGNITLWIITISSLILHWENFDHEHEKTNIYKNKGVSPIIYCREKYKYKITNKVNADSTIKRLT